MIIADDFRISETEIQFKKDRYPLCNIKDARVQTNTFQDHALRIITIGLIASSIVWVICPESLGLFSAPIALSIGMLVALSSVRKYELQIEFQHVDETGLQWVSVAKTNQQKVKRLFEEHATSILDRVI